MTVIYLAGPIFGATDETVFAWRNEFMALLENGHTVLSPVERDYRHGEVLHVRDIVEGDKADIDKADTVIAYTPYPSVGTSMEVLYAWEHGKHVIVFAPHDMPISPWLRYHCHHISHTIKDVLERL